MSQLNQSNVFLVRHAQSQANADYKVLHEITNMKVNITSTGEKQSKETGDFLSSHIKKKLENPSMGEIVTNKIIIWNSPYTRTRQTASIIGKSLNSSSLKDTHEILSKESIYLVERNFGLVDALDDYFDKYTDEAAYYKRHSLAGDTFFCKPPLGESPFDLAMRMHQFYLQEVVTRPSAIHIIVSHGASLRALNLMVNNMPYESFLSSNPYNASVSVFGESGLQTIFYPNDITS